MIDDGALEVVADTDHPSDTRSTRGGHPRRGVFEHDALLGRETEAPSAEKIRLRVGFASLDIFGRDEVPWLGVASGRQAGDREPARGASGRAAPR